MTFETKDVERKTYSILKVLANNPRTLGSLVIARQLKDMGVDLGARAVRYHLKLTDEQGLTHLAGWRDGRQITELGLKELKQGMVKDKVGFAISRIELLAFRTSFDINKQTGNVPVNISVMEKQVFHKALHIMRPVFTAKMCVSDLVQKVDSGGKIGDYTVPENKVALVTVCSVVINGTLLKLGIPMNSKFGGLLQIQRKQPLRFTELIHYDGCSLDPSAVFIKARMTSVSQAVKTGNGNILANFREVSSICRPLAEQVVDKLNKARLHGVILLGNPSEPVCEMQMELNRMGMVLMGGLNPIAAVEEAGLEVESFPMSTVVDYRDLVRFEELLT
jgi:HTH-type transcriptional regulator, global nitrogen regulator NrpRI